MEHCAHLAWSRSVIRSQSLHFQPFPNSAEFWPGAKSCHEKRAPENGLLLGKPPGQMRLQKAYEFCKKKLQTGFFSVLPIVFGRFWTLNVKLATGFPLCMALLWRTVVNFLNCNENTAGDGVSGPESTISFNSDLYILTFSGLLMRNEICTRIYMYV